MNLFVRKTSVSYTTLIMIRIGVRIGSLAVGLLCCQSFAKGELIVSLPTGVSGGSLNVSTLATGMSFPYSMQASNGFVLAGVSNPQSGGDYLSATGGLVQIAPNGTQSSVYSAFPAAVQSVRRITDNLYAVAQAGTDTTQITFMQPGAHPGDSFTNLGAINFAASNAGEIFNITLATRQTPGQNGSYDLFFSMNGDTDHTQSTGSATLSGLASGSLEYNSIAKVTVTPTGGAPTVTGLQEVAKGVRNTAGMVFDAAGNLYLGDNGWDVPNTSTPQSADELNFLAASAIANGTIADFGFPNNYIDYATGTFVGGNGIAPLAAFLPQNGNASLGIAEMALAPVNFPTGLNNGLFVSFYGKWEQAGANNNTGPLLYYDFGTGHYSTFIASGQTGVGHLTSLTSTADALYIGDMNSYGTVRHGPIDGVVYEIQANTPEPATWTMILGGLALCAMLARAAKTN